MPDPRTSLTVIVTLSDSCRTRPHLFRPGAIWEKSNVFLRIIYSGVFNSNPAFFSLARMEALSTERNVASISFFITAVYHELYFLYMPRFLSLLFCKVSPARIHSPDHPPRGQNVKTKNQPRFCEI